MGSKYTNKFSSYIIFYCRDSSRGIALHIFIWRAENVGARTLRNHLASWALYPSSFHSSSIYHGGREGTLFCTETSEAAKPWRYGHKDCYAILFPLGFLKFLVFEIILHLEPCIIHLSTHPLYTTEVAKALCFAQRPQRRQSREGMGTKIATQFYFPWVS